MAKFLGIDYGLQRTGLAISDPEGSVVFPLGTLHLKDFKNRAALLDEMARIGREKGIDNLVIGLPLHLDGSENEMCRIVRNFIPRIKRRLNVPCYLMPETLSTEAARELLAQMKKNRIKAVLDQQAACLILSSFLEQPPEYWKLA